MSISSVSIKAAVGTLLVAATASIALACAGAEGALELMKYRFAFFVVGLLGAASSLPVLTRRPSFSRIPSLLLHTGFALVLFGWLGNEIAQDLGMSPEDGYLRLRAGQAGRVGTDFSLILDDFSIERWPDTGTVRQYVSKVEVANVMGAPLPDSPHAEISVNHPLVRDGWWIYQSSFQEMTNPHNGMPLLFTVLSCVKDVGLPVVTVGAIALLLGAFALAVLTFGRGRGGSVPQDGADAKLLRLYFLLFVSLVAMLVHRGVATGHPPMQNMYEFLMCSATLVPVLTFASRKLDGRNTLLVDVALIAFLMMPVGFFMNGEVKRLMPALQSPFFVPHVGAYVLGYLLLVRAALGAGTRFVGVGFALLTVGLVLGAAWGKVCWGHWWQFDPKEMWSLATWFVYAAYFHVRHRLSPREERCWLVAGAILVILTLTWINVSRIFSGMHSYA